MDYANRRQFLQTATLTVAAAALQATADAAEPVDGAGRTIESLPAFAAAHRPKALGFDPAKLNGLSEKLIRSHWENNYGGSVKALNAIKQRVALMVADNDAPAYVFNDLKREHLLRTGSVIFHELYFDNLGPSTGPDVEARKLIAGAYGDFSTWETEFRRIGTGLGGGSGWVVLGFNLHTGQLENYWLWDHMHGPAATLPILVMDMYEHSYQMDYGAGAAKYIDAFFRNIHWETVVVRLTAAQRIFAQMRT